MIKSIILWFKKIWRRFKHYRRVYLAQKNLEKAYQIQLLGRKTLRKDINKFLRKYFGVDARSKFIPKDFKNNEEVKVAIIDKFGDRMQSLNITYTQLFK